MFSSWGQYTEHMTYARTWLRKDTRFCDQMLTKRFWWELYLLMSLSICNKTDFSCIILWYSFKYKQLHQDILKQSNAKYCNSPYVFLIQFFYDAETRKRTIWTILSYQGLRIRFHCSSIGIYWPTLPGEDESERFL